MMKQDMMPKGKEVDTVAKPVYNVIKRILDLILSVVFFVVLLPVFIVFSIIIFVCDGYCPLYFQKRIGRYGKTFTLIKFRTMKHDAHDFEKYMSEEQLRLYNSEYKLEDDPRITAFGRFLRRFSLDELPQLWNVIVGQMSLVGPRPLTEEETYLFGDRRDLLLSVRPGITGLWQVSGRNDLTYESGARQRCEIEYVEHFGVAMDLKVFVKTFKEVFSGSGK